MPLYIHKRRVIVSSNHLHAPADAQERDAVILAMLDDLFFCLVSIWNFTDIVAAGKQVPVTIDTADPVKQGLMALFR